MAHRLDRGKNVHFALDVFRQMAEIMFPTRLTLNSWFKSPTQSPIPHQKKNRDYNGNFCKGYVRLLFYAVSATMAK